MNHILADIFQKHEVRRAGRRIITSLTTAGILLFLILTLRAEASEGAYDRGIRQVRELVALQRLDEADRRLTAMLRQYPGNPELLAYRGRVRLWNYYPSGAVRDLKQSLSRREDRAVRRELASAMTAAQIARAEIHLARNEPATATRLLKRLFDTGRNRYRTGLLLARIYTSSGSHDKAAEIYRILTEEYPGEHDLTLLLVRSLIRSGRNDQAEQTVRQLPSVEHPSLHLARATLATSQKRYGEALEHYRKALKLSDDPAIQSEIQSVETLLAFQNSDAFLTAGNSQKAADILRPLYMETKKTYDIAHRLGRLAQERNDFVEALVMYRHIMEQYPSDAEARMFYFDMLLLAGKLDEASSFIETAAVDSPQWKLRRACLLFREGSFTEATAEYRKAEQTITDPAVARELFKTEMTARLRMAARIAEEGKIVMAERMWQELFDTGTERYESGIRLARLAQQRGDFSRAATICSELSRSYPNDQDLRLYLVDALLASGDTAGAGRELDLLAKNPSPLVSLRQARLTYRLKRYEESVQAFRHAGDSLEPTVKGEREAAENALALEKALTLMRAGKLDEAMSLWSELFDSGRERYESGHQLGMTYLKRRQFDTASAHFTGLSAEFPKDAGIYALAVESNILAKNIGLASEMVEKATPVQREFLATEREDLLYRVRPNYLMVSGLVAGYDNDFETETGFSLTLSQRISRSTLVVNAGSIHRYGLDDTQFGAELFFPLGTDSRLSGNLAFAFSPDADFLPEHAIRGEVTYSGDPLEYSIGYTRMEFKNEGVDILLLGVLGYLTPTLSLGERVYIVPENGTFSFLTTVHYEPDHRIRGYCSLGMGTASDRIGAHRDLQRYFTVSNRIGAEYRLTPAISGGGEFFVEYRKNLYSRYGTQLFVRYWW